MELRKIKHYIQRAFQLGPKGSFLLIHNRFKNEFYHTYWRKKALSKTASYSWGDIKKNHKKSYEDVNHLWADQQKKLHFCVEELKIDVEQKALIACADDFVNNCFSVLGSPKKQYSSIPWHTDIRLQAMDFAADCTFDATLYYKDVVIQSGKDSFIKDIKVPWELSRLQHFFVLGYAYNKTNNEIYAQTFANHYNDWLENNSFLLGPNWVCPMDVGIRAVNLIWALSLFKESKTLSAEFLEKITTSLYDHLYYLEHNWEIYDDLRSSNHYLSDLIGYFYLCYFFNNLSGIRQRAHWCYQELLKEFEKQIFEDGSDYEGSTSYHMLITEIFYHFYMLGKKMGFVFEQKFIDRFHAMFSFIDWCTPEKSTCPISIGDNDSGKLLYYGLGSALIESLKKPAKNNQIDFKDFGLSIIKTDEVHASLRHHVFQDRQPSGHFHNDYASVTLSVNGVPLFVDPGSYIYTPSAQWRNHFRSVKTHNTFYLKGSEPVPFNEHLFQHDLTEQKFLQNWVDTDQWTLKTSHELYKSRYGLTAYRTLVYDQKEKVVTITDRWKSDQSSDSYPLGVWNFILNPSLVVEKKDEAFVFYYQEKEIATFQSTIYFELKDGFVSYEYGTKIPTQRLEASVNIIHDDPIVSTICYYD
jgi:hypothetical protein